MKKIVYISILCLVSFKATAQRKHSFALQADRTFTSNSREWRQSEYIKPRSSGLTQIDDMGLSLSYFYKNKYSIKTQLTAIDQHAGVNPAASYLHNYIASRRAAFADLMIGYNFAGLYLKNKPKSYLNHLGLWAWAGAGMMMGNSEQVRQDYSPGQAEGGWWCILNSETEDYSYKVRPLAQVMLKYNPIRYAYIGVGGTYRYIAGDFQPLSLNVSIGLQL